MFPTHDKIKQTMKAEFGGKETKRKENSLCSSCIFSPYSNCKLNDMLIICWVVDEAKNLTVNLLQLTQINGKGGFTFNSINPIWKERSKKALCGDVL
ncbi:hypothetical protein SNEBB_001189 [Seison nebaliae]|nr:hypothetical protein SNEBB_001189 [Seison nebaliae]